MCGCARWKPGDSGPLRLLAGCSVQFGNVRLQYCIRHLRRETVQLTARLAAKGLHIFAQLTHSGIEPRAESVDPGEHLAQCRFLIWHRTESYRGRYGGVKP